jgi:hypothetical protein
MNNTPVGVRSSETLSHPNDMNMNKMNIVSVRVLHSVLLDRSQYASGKPDQVFL